MAENFPNSAKKYKFTYLRSSVNLKDKLKENYTYIDHRQTVKNQRWREKISKTIRKRQLVSYRGTTILIWWGNGAKVRLVFTQGLGNGGRARMQT